MFFILKSYYKMYKTYSNHYYIFNAIIEIMSIVLIIFDKEFIIFVMKKTFNYLL